MSLWPSRRARHEGKQVRSRIQLPGTQLLWRHISQSDVTGNGGRGLDLTENKPIRKGPCGQNQRTERETRSIRASACDQDPGGQRRDNSGKVCHQVRYTCPGSHLVLGGAALWETHMLAQLNPTSVAPTISQIAADVLPTRTAGINSSPKRDPTLTMLLRTTVSS